MTFSSSGGCSNTGATFTMTSGATACQVKYDEAGDANYSAAPTVTETVTASKAAQTITVTTHAPGSAVYNTGFSVAATGGGSGNAVTFSSSGGCSNTGADLHDDQRHHGLLGQVRPGRQCELQRGGDGHRDRQRAEGGSVDQRDHAGAVDGRVRDVVLGCGDCHCWTRLLLERRGLPQHRRHLHDDERHRHLHREVRPAGRQQLQRRYRR